MKAAVCVEFGKPLAIEDLDLAPPGPGEVRVRISACAVCHSDILFADGSWGGALPAVYGHEAAGVIDTVGPGVAGLAPGDHVVVTLIRSCGECHYCSRGLQVACETEFELDRKGPLARRSGEPVVHGLRTGAFAEEVTVHASQVVAVPRDIPMAAASLLACGVITGFGAAAHTAAVRPGDSAVVIGAGGVGLNAVQGAAVCGAGTVIAVDIVSTKLEAALRFGATHAFDGSADGLVEEVRRLTGGRGADHVFVTVGVRAAFEQAFSLLARAGAVVLVGMPANGVMAEFDPGTMAGQSQRMLGSKMGGARIRSDIPYLVSLYRQGRLKLDELITARYPLDGINDAIAAVKQGEALRNVIEF